MVDVLLKGVFGALPFSSMRRGFNTACGLCFCRRVHLELMKCTCLHAGGEGGPEPSMSQEPMFKMYIYVCV